jgi:hypothetical protein
MTTSLIIIRYRKRYIPFALLAMAIFRFPLWFNKNISFWKLLGSGRNGTFDKTPDWQQWGILAVHQTPPATLPFGKFIDKWLHLFKCETLTYTLNPIEGHGKWDGKKAFGEFPVKSDYEGMVAVLTRATIRISKLKQFWNHVAPVADLMRTSESFITSYGVGEMPWLKQATFSIWKDKEGMKNFAYKMQAHAEVIRKTRQEKWYSEDMFVRFEILSCTGTINGINPLKGML